VHQSIVLSGLIRIILSITGWGAVCLCHKCLMSMDGSTYRRVAMD